MSDRKAAVEVGTIIGLCLQPCFLVNMDLSRGFEAIPPPFV